MLETGDTQRAIVATLEEVGQAIIPVQRPLRPVIRPPPTAVAASMAWSSEVHSSRRSHRLAATR